MLKIVEINSEEHFNSCRSRELTSNDYLYICKYDNSIKLSDNGELKHFDVNISELEGNALKRNEDGTLYVEDKTEVIQQLEIISKSISKSQKYVNTELDYCYLTVLAESNIQLTTGYIVPFSQIDSNMETNEASHSVILKAGKTYKISCDIYIGNGYISFAIFDRTNDKTLKYLTKSGMNVDAKSSNCDAMVVYTPKNDCEIQVKVTYVELSPTFVANANRDYLIIEEINHQITIDPVEHINTTNGIEDTPVGHVISHMGNNAPKHYLICDGSEYNITDYPYLAQHMIDNFGSVNYFGGDGIDTFCVPDLRGEFLRGTGTANRNSGSGSNVGEHQEGTKHQYWYVGESNLCFYGNVADAASVKAMDTTIKETTKGHKLAYENYSSTSAFQYYTSRPTNTSVLYCIKYEPTYFMNIFGLREETVLFEGEASALGDYVLTDSIKNYDEIYILARMHTAVNKNGQSMLINTKDIDISDSQESFVFGFSTATNDFRIYGFNFSRGYNIFTVTYLRNVNTSAAVTKIIGIKYRNTTEGTATSGPSYTDDEVSNMITDILGGEE